MDVIELLAQRWLSIMLRAVLIIGPMTVLFFVWKPKFLARFRIAQPRTVALQIRDEIPRSVVGLSVYLFPALILFYAKTLFGYSKMYTDVYEFGLIYFFFSIFIFIAAFDTWFYWVHRLMHSNKYLRRVHGVHHRSYNVNPVSGYSMHFVEAVLVMLPYIALTLLVPWHPVALLVFGVFGIFFNGYLHLGHDFGHEWRARNSVFKWINSATYHSSHHHHSEGNYSNYFTFWDRVMGTHREPGPELRVQDR